MRVWPGRPYPLGATWDGAGVNFALFSEHATKVELCLFDSPGRRPRSRSASPLPEHTDQVWHAYLPDVLPGQLYGYRVHGPYEPQQGPPLQPEQGRARSVRQGDRPRPALGRLRCSATRSATPTADLSFDDRDSAAFAPLAAVIDPAFTWGDDRPPRTPWHKTLIYELHVKGFTQRHPDVPEKLRGTYAGLASEAAIKHLTRPGRHGRRAAAGPPLHVDDRHLVEKGRRNYWGYNTLAFFAPDVRYACARHPRRTPCSSSR